MNFDLSKNDNLTANEDFLPKSRKKASLR